LELLRELLAEDGTLFVHIDDNELGYLIPIADEVMGRKNRISIVTFKQGAPTGHKAINPGMVTTTNFVVVYAKNKDHWKPNRLFTGRGRDDRYNQFIANFEDPYPDWKTIPLSKALASFKGQAITELKKQLSKEEFEKELNHFVLKNAHRIIESARPNYQGVGAQVKKVIDLSKSDPSKIYLHQREGFSDMYFKGGQRWLFYKDKLKEVDGQTVAGEPLTTLWDDLLSNNLHNEGAVSFTKGKKPEALIKRAIELSTSDPNDIVLDSFLGSGTTAAAAHKMGRRWIGVEMGDHAVTHCVPRLQKVIEGEQGGISQAMNWKGGGGFRFYRLGPAITDETGQINKDIRFAELAAHIWFGETHRPLSQQQPASPLLGIDGEKAIYLLYNGILGDAKSNALTSRVLRRLPAHQGPKVIYAECTSLDDAVLQKQGIAFKHIPYDIKGR